MLNYTKNMRVALIAIMLMFLALGVFAPGAALAAGVSGVTRAVAAASGGQNVVTIGIDDTMPSVVGVKETLPEGCTLVSCTLPQDQYKVSGRDASFVAINTTSFKYVVKGLEGKEISGQWTDMLGTGQGTVSVEGAAGTGTGGTGSSGGNSRGNAQATPGFIALVAFVSICIGALLLTRRDDE